MRQPTNPICAVLIHVTNWREGFAWYRPAFPTAKEVHPPGDDWMCLELDGTQIEIVPTDDKVTSGTAGTVVYWFTDDFHARMNYLQSIGAVLYRGPMEIEHGMAMCQFKDPFGNLLGIRGPQLTLLHASRT
jgi:predicted enzyme related to lactoylglutathione lyase